MKLKITNKRAFRSLALKLSLCMAALFVCQNAKAADGDEFSYEYEGQTLNYTVISEANLTCEVKAGINFNAGNPNVSGVLIIPEKAISSSNGSAYTVTSIGYGAFVYCRSLKEVIIPNSVTEIGNRTFMECGNLTEVTIGNSVNSIGYQAFKFCESLTELIMPNSVISIGEEAFGTCLKLREVTIPNSVTSIGDGAFDYCTSLTEVTIPNSVTELGASVFYKCSSLTEVTIPNSVASIGSFAFEDCSSLTEVTIPNSVTSIGKWAFSGCASLTEVAIPNSVTSIGDGPFGRCTSLPEIKVEESNPSYISIDGILFNKIQNLLVQYPAGKTDTNYTIPNSVTSIGDNAFSGCASLTEVTIPNSVTSIGDYAFYNCSSLKEATIPNSVTSIGSWAFSYCSSLTEVVIPNTVTTLMSYTFLSCISLREVTIPNSVTLIGESTFHDCSSLTEVTIPNSVSIIGRYAFAQCKSLKDVKIGNSVTNIKGYAFAQCPSLKEVTCLNPEPQGYYYADYIFDKSPISDAILYVPEESVEIYQKISPWSEFDQILPVGSEINPEISINGYTGAALAIGESLQLSASISPEDLDDVTLIWSSSDENVATVNASGLVEAVGEGTAVITVSLEGYDNVSASVELMVVDSSEPEPGETPSMKITGFDSTTLSVFDTVQLFAVITPDDLENVTLIWSSSDENVATVNASGLVEAVGEGTAVITVSLDGYDNVSASVELMVVDSSEPEPEPGVTPSMKITGYDSTTLFVFDTVQLFAVITPEPEENTTVVWTSSDSEIADVDQTGMVTVFEEGKVTITATLAAYPEVSASVTFTIASSTGIALIAPDAEGSYNVYTLSGNLILSTRNADDLSRLQKGLYIINGNKVVVR